MRIVVGGKCPGGNYPRCELSGLRASREQLPYRWEMSGGQLSRGKWSRDQLSSGAVTQGELARTLSLDAFIRWKQFLRKCICSITFIYCTIKNYYGQSNFVNRIKSIFPKRTINKSASIKEVTYSKDVFRSLSNI